MLVQPSVHELVLTVAENRSLRAKRAYCFDPTCHLLWTCFQCPSDHPRCPQQTCGQWQRNWTNSL